MHEVIGHVRLDWCANLDTASHRLAQWIIGLVFIRVGASRGQTEGTITRNYLISHRKTKVRNRDVIMQQRRAD